MIKEINQDNVTKLKALLDKGETLPYKKLARNCARYAIDPKLSKNCFVNKSIRKGLIAFGEYLENKKAIMPLKIDVIDFVLQKHGESPRTLQWYFSASMEFVIFCQENYSELFNGILVDTGATRATKFIEDSIITEDKVVFLTEEDFKNV